MTTHTESSPTTDEPVDVLGSLIQLLADEAPAAEFDALERRARATTGTERALLVRAVDHARQVAGVLAHRERRERGMQALYETARDLTSLRDVDEVLTAIVHRARRLLATDSTYIALVDEQTGDAYMRVTSGTITPAIRSVRQAPGCGIGGGVIQTGQPVATSNYLADPRIERDPAVAKAVGADGIISIAGAPMKLGHRVVGTLLAADRQERVFDQPEIAVLSSLAQHAAIVIENARLYDQVRGTTQNLRDVNDQLSARRQALELAGSAHERLLPLALTRADFDQLRTTLGEILGGVATLDIDGHGGAADGHAAVVPLRAGGHTYGRLLLDRPEPVTGAETRVLEGAAQTATLLLLMRHQASIAEQDLRRELVEDLLAAHEPDWESLQRRADRFEVLATDMLHVVVVLSARTPVPALLDAAGSVTANQGGLAGEHARQVVALLPVSDGGAGDTAREVAARLSHAIGTPVTAGGAGPAIGARAIRDLHQAAARCHTLLMSLGRDGHGAAIDELGVVGKVLWAVSPEQLHRMVARELGPLLDYDAKRSSSLLATVRSYFEQGQNPPAAARTLAIHINTLYQRLERIDQVLGGRHWREPPGAVDMQLALHVHGLMPARRLP
ncbi:MAG: GAF domain-containing protein [Actinophytocola sp.]|nr:GAF domain-containing protein [Actinophytocola sp.]